MPAGVLDSAMVVDARRPEMRWVMTSRPTWSKWLPSQRMIECRLGRQMPEERVWPLS